MTGMSFSSSAAGPPVAIGRPRALIHVLEWQRPPVCECKRSLPFIYPAPHHRRCGFLPSLLLSLSIEARLGEDLTY